MGNDSANHHPPHSRERRGLFGAVIEIEESRLNMAPGAAIIRETRMRPASAVDLPRARARFRFTPERSPQ